MNRTSTWLGVALVVVGGLWFFQGIGVAGGSIMSGVAFWAVLGPLVALVGLAMVLRGVRR